MLNDQSDIRAELRWGGEGHGGLKGKGSRTVAAQDDFLKVDRNIKTLRQLCLDKMRDAILTAHFAPGERLVERTLCEQLDVSRTVVREVLRHLESEGLVEIIPHLGPVVAHMDEDTATQIYELRANLEVIGARACAEQASDADVKLLQRHLEGIELAYRNNDKRGLMTATTEFYRVMFASGGKDVAWTILHRLDARINTLRGMTSESIGRAEASIDEMRNIFSAILARDPGAAEKACVAHIKKAHEVALAILASSRK